MEPLLLSIVAPEVPNFIKVPEIPKWRKPKVVTKIKAITLAKDERGIPLPPPMALNLPPLPNFEELLKNAQMKKTNNQKRLSVEQTLQVLQSTKKRISTRP